MHAFPIRSVVDSAVVDIAAAQAVHLSSMPRQALSLPLSCETPWRMLSGAKAILYGNAVAFAWKLFRRGALSLSKITLSQWLQFGTPTHPTARRRDGPPCNYAPARRPSNFSLQYVHPDAHPVSHPVPDPVPHSNPDPVPALYSFIFHPYIISIPLRALTHFETYLFCLCLSLSLCLCLSISLPLYISLSMSLFLSVSLSL